MICLAVIPQPYDMRKGVSSGMTNSVVYGFSDIRHPVGVLDTDQLLARLKERGIKNVEIAKALGLPDSRIPEIRDKRRAIKLDEAARLVRAFSLEQSQEAAPLPAPVLRLIVRHITRKIGTPLPDHTVDDLTEDLRAFSVFVADPKVRGSIEAAEAFFQALQLRNPDNLGAAPPENDPERTR